MSTVIDLTATSVYHKNIALIRLFEMGKLHGALKSWHTTKVKQLLKPKAVDIKKLKDYGDTPLNMAIFTDKSKSQSF